MTKLKAFFKKWVWNNLGYKIAAIVLAFVLWLVILNVTDPDATKTITGLPVTIENEDTVLDGSRIYEIVSGKTTSITITGARSIISSLSASDFIATADFSELSTSNSVSITVELTGDMSKYSNKVDITVKTSTMVIDIDEITTLKVPVEIIFSGTLDDDEFIDSYTVTPEYVTVTAPQSVLDTISAAQVYVDYGDIDGESSLRTDIIICNSAGAQVDLGTYGSVDYTTAIVDIGASYTKTVSIHMDDPADDTAEGYEFDSLSYSMTSVTIKGNKELISKISEIEIPSALLDLTDAASDVSITVSLSDYLPDGVTVYGDVSKVVITANVTASATEATTQAAEESTEDTTSADTGGDSEEESSSE